MRATKTYTPGEACPQCGAPMVIDEAQRPETVVDRLKRNTANPAVAMRKGELIEGKAIEHGLIHKCLGCGYRIRFHAPAAGQTKAGDGAKAEDGALESTRGKTTPARRGAQA